MTIYEFTYKAIDVLNEAGIEYFIAGSLSSMYYSFTRSTADADFVIQLKEVSVARLVARMGPEFRLDPQVTFETMTMTTRHVVVIAGSPLKLEFFQLSNDPFDLSRFQRRVPVVLEGHRAFLPTAEDVIVMKMRWRRPKDIEDVRNILAVQGPQTLDWEYMRQWCELHGSHAELERLRNEIRGE